MECYYNSWKEKKKIKSHLKLKNSASTRDRALRGLTEETLASLSHIFSSTLEKCKQKEVRTASEVIIYFQKKIGNAAGNDGKENN